MNKKLLMPIALTILLLGITFVYASMIQKDNGNYQIETNVQTGWNIIQGFYPDFISASSELKKEDISAVFMYIPDKNQYLRLYPDSQLSREKLASMGIDSNDEYYDDYAGLYSFWVYANKPGKLVYETHLMGDMKNIQMKSGWNFVGINLNFYQVKVKDFRGNCDIEKMGVYDFGEWKVSNYTTYENEFIADSEQDIGKGAVIKVSSNCQLGISEISVSPPTLP